MGVHGDSYVLHHGDSDTFFRLIERIHAVDESGKNLGKGHGDLGQQMSRSDLMFLPYMLIPLLIASPIVTLSESQQKWWI